MSLSNLKKLATEHFKALGYADWKLSAGDEREAVRATANALRAAIDAEPDELLPVAQAIQNENVALRAERDSLSEFKAFVHRRLDEAGVPVDPPSPHREAGCRIGGRLDVVLGERDSLRKELNRVKALNGRLSEDLEGISDGLETITALREVVRQMREALTRAAKDEDGRIHAPTCHLGHQSDENGNAFTDCNCGVEAALTAGDEVLKSAVQSTALDTTRGHVEEMKALREVVRQMPQTAQDILATRGQVFENAEFREKHCVAVLKAAADKALGEGGK